MQLQTPYPLAYEATPDEELYRVVTAQSDITGRYNTYNYTESLLSPELVFDI